MKSNNSPKSLKDNFSDYEQEIISGLMSGKPLGGKDGVLTNLISFVVNKAMDAELGEHLEREASKLDALTAAQGQVSSHGKNKRNGRAKKTLTTDFGPADIEPSRDRNGTYESEIVPKWQRDLAPNMSNQILSLYARGSSQQDISDHLYELFGQRLSKASISRVVDDVWPSVVEWQERGLQAFYVAIFMDAIHHKIRLEGRSTSVATYIFYGVDAHGQRDILTIHTGQGAESASTWSVLMEELKERGVEDVLVFISDGLSGTREVIQQHFPTADQQRCVVHKIRNSMLGVKDKCRKKLAGDLRKVYTARDADAALEALEALETKWPQYPHVGRSWRKDWTELMHFMEYGPHMRRLIYTTNALENVNRHIRRVTKSKGSWTSQRSLVIQIHLIIQATEDAWKRRVFNFSAVQQELMERHAERYLRHVTT